MQKKQIVIITVPHSECLDREDLIFKIRTCDYRAEQAAKILYHQLIQNGIKSEILIGDITRIKIDLNRKESRNTQFRTQLASKIKQYISEDYDVFVIDMHSFPSNDFCIYFISFPQVSQFAHLAAQKLERFTTIPIYKGQNNDIIEQAYDLGATSILIEVNEDKNKLSDKLLTTILANFSRLFNSKLSNTIQKNKIIISFILSMIIITLIIILYLQFMPMFQLQPIQLEKHQLPFDDAYIYYP